nr:MAG TPA: hypothetical protein [Caudoviricetes sp.]
MRTTQRNAHRRQTPHAPPRAPRSRHSLPVYESPGPDPVHFDP